MLFRSVSQSRYMGVLLNKSGVQCRERTEALGEVPSMKWCSSIRTEQTSNKVGLVTVLSPTLLVAKDIIVMLYLYSSYSASVKGMGEALRLSYLGCFNIVRRLIGMGYIERINAYSVILTSKGVLYVESFI